MRPDVPKGVDRCSGQMGWQRTHTHIHMGVKCSDYEATAEKNVGNLRLEVGNAEASEEMWRLQDLYWSGLRHIRLLRRRRLPL